MKSVSGIRLVDDYTLEITMERDGEENLRCLRELYLLPLDAYGDRSLFRPEEGSYGFAFGDLGTIRANPGQSGAGAYYLSFQDGNMPYLEANPCYYLGRAAIAAVNFLCLPEEMLDAVAQGLADAALLAGNRERFLQAESLGLLRSGVAADVFGCLALWNDGVSVSGDGEGEALQRAVLTVLQACCALSAQEYFGASARVLPAPTVEEAAAEAEALLSGLGFAAGEDGAGAPAVELELLIPGGGTGDHPCWAGALQAAELLQRLGLALRVTDVRSSNEFWDLVDSHGAAAWAAAEQLPVWADASSEAVFGPEHAQLLLYQRCDLAVFSPERVQKDSIPAEQTAAFDWISCIQNLQLR